MAPQFLLAGLGNPGAEYASQRHNIGFMAIDAVHGHYRGGSWIKKFQAQICEIKIANASVLLLKPQTFMNLSGVAVAQAVQFYKIPPDNVYIVHDEIELIPGKARLKQGGGHAGHNGLKSVDAAIGPHYWRLRLGVGRPVVAEDVADYVLHDFAKADFVWIEKLCTTLARQAPLLLDPATHAELLNRLTLALAPPK